MHRLIGSAVLVTAMATAACDESPTQPSQETITFTAQLSPASEVPPVTNAEAGGTGAATIELNVDRNSSGTITDASADFQVTMTGFPAGTPLTMAHIHTGSAGVNGAIVVNTGLTAGETTLVSGAGGFVKAGIDVTPADAQDLIDDPGTFYFNVHSVLNPGGLARGQLVRQ